MTGTQGAVHRLSTVGEKKRTSHYTVDKGATDPCVPAPHAMAEKAHRAEQTEIAPPQLSQPGLGNLPPAPAFTGTSRQTKRNADFAFVARQHARYAHPHTNTNAEGPKDSWNNGGSYLRQDLCGAARRSTATRLNCDRSLNDRSCANRSRVLPCRFCMRVGAAHHFPSHRKNHTGHHRRNE